MIGEENDEEKEEAEDSSGASSKTTDADIDSETVRDALSSKGDDEDVIKSREPDFEFQGKDGRVELYDEKLVLRRDSMRAKLTNYHLEDGLEILYDNIGEVKIGGLFENVLGGFIEFVRMTDEGVPMDADRFRTNGGRTHVRSKTGWTQVQANAGWNRVAIGRNQRKEAEKLKQEVEKRARAANDPQDEFAEAKGQPDSNDTDDPAIQTLREKFALSLIHI